MSLTSRQAPIEASKPFVLRGLILLAMVLVIVVILGLVFSRQLAQGVRALLGAMNLYAQGDRNARIENAGKDELGMLADRFNRMADEVNRLMEQEADKAKIEHEMSLVASLQQRFLPPPENKFDSLTVLGSVIPAVKSGGDWWFVFEIENRLVVGVGDVTGHGVNSTMVTAAARAAISYNETQYLSPSNLMSVMNRCVYDIAQDELQMTALVMEIDRREGIIRYCNASHEAPFLLPMQVNGPGSPSELYEIHGPRLGEGREFVFGESKFRPDGPFRLWLYTDGLKDSVDPEGKTLGERRLGKLLAQASEVPQAPEAFQSLIQSWKEFCAGAELPDDCTAVLVDSATLKLATL